MEEKLRIVHQILGSSRKSRDEYLFHCPYCNHHKKKLSINFGKMRLNVGFAMSVAKTFIVLFASLEVINSVKNGLNLRVA